MRDGRQPIATRSSALWRAVDLWGGVAIAGLFAALITVAAIAMQPKTETECRDGIWCHCWSEPGAHGLTCGIRE